MRNDERLMVTELNEVNENKETAKEVDEKDILREYEDILGY